MDHTQGNKTSFSAPIITRNNNMQINDWYSNNENLDKTTNKVRQEVRTNYVDNIWDTNQGYHQRQLGVRNINAQDNFNHYNRNGFISEVYEHTNDADHFLYQ